MGELVTGLVLTYEVAANYKVVTENYNECYHCGPVHPELTRLVPSFGAGGTGIDWENGVPLEERGVEILTRCLRMLEQAGTMPDEEADALYVDVVGD